MAMMILRTLVLKSVVVTYFGKMITENIVFLQIKVGVHGMIGAFTNKITWFGQLGRMLRLGSAAMMTPDLTN